MDATAAWKATLGELELQMTRATFNTWLKDTRLLSSDNGAYTVGVRNDYAKDWLSNRLRETILRTLSDIVEDVNDIRFVVWADEAGGNGAARGQRPSKNGTGKANGRTRTARSQPTSANGRSNAKQQLTKTGQAGDTMLNTRFTFASFIVGASNRLAHAAALSVAENPGHNYNPLFIYGGVGLGKTHLLHAIGHRCRNAGFTVLYISSETFTNDLVQSIRNKQMDQFREKYRTPDVLLIDDIQFIAGKESTQEELFHTFNELHSQGKQVVMSSDRTPKAMVTLEERLQSRFEWGLMADIQLPDVETRKAILQAKAEELGIDVPDHALDTLAQYVRNNIRELEGALNKVSAYAQLSNSPIDDELIEMALADIIGRPQKVTVEQVINAVCRHYDVTDEALSGSSRARVIAFPRQVVMYLSRTETNASLPQIGTRLGDRDHTTIMYGHNKISSLVEKDETVRREMMTIKANLYESMMAGA